MTADTSRPAPPDERPAAIKKTGGQRHYELAGRPIPWWDLSRKEREEWERHHRLTRPDQEHAPASASAAGPVTLRIRDLATQLRELRAKAETRGPLLEHSVEGYLTYESGGYACMHIPNKGDRALLCALVNNLDTILATFDGTLALGDAGFAEGVEAAAVRAAEVVAPFGSPTLTEVVMREIRALRRPAPSEVPR